MRADALNLHVYPAGTEMTGTKQIPTSHVYYKDESELKEFLVDENLSQICSRDKDESKGIIVDAYSTKGGRIRMRSQKINKQKNAKNKAEYEEHSVTDEVPSYFNIFECGRNILNIIDVIYERACMATQK